ncbi:hypothetical protein [Actinoplanes sp. NPDC051494]|uniref:hypothetical protein n=1 Tax=Actinoplanes sp. NPDC051494 TaxID=3363907 RepID=UPI00378D479A
MPLSCRLNRSGVLAVLISTALATGCAGSPAPSAPAPTSAANGLLAAVRHSGGLCSTGPCATDLTVYGDGRWDLRDESSGNRSGTLSDDQVRELRTLVTETDLPSATTTIDCADNYDGIRVTYTIGSDPETVIDSCSIRIAGPNPLIERLDDLFQELGQK